MPDLKIKKCSVILIETKAANTHGNSGGSVSFRLGRWSGRDLGSSHQLWQSGFRTTSRPPFSCLSALAGFVLAKTWTLQRLRKVNNYYLVLHHMTFNENSLNQDSSFQNKHPSLPNTPP